jgi:hypothetical protein
LKLMTDSEDIAKAADVVEAISNTRSLDIAARVGFAVMALLHIIVGAIALALAFGQPGEADATGAIERLADHPWGLLSLWTGFIGCLALAVWQFSEATLRARRLPTKQRLSKLVSSGFLSIAYGSVGITFGSFAVGIRSDSGEATRDFSTSVMRTGLGAPVLIAVGLTVIGIGI